MCIVCIANNINRNVYMYLNTRIFPTTGYARVLLFMFIRREQGGTRTGCLFQFTYCDKASSYTLGVNVFWFLFLMVHQWVNCGISYIYIFILIVFFDSVVRRLSFVRP